MAVLNWKDRWGLWSHFSTAVLVLIQVGLLFWGISFFLPNFWAEQVVSGFWLNFVIFLFIAVATAFGEWFFHRDIQHGLVVSWVRYAYYRHGLHHSLTPITVRRIGSSQMIVNSQYPMIRHEQYQSVFFPAYMFLTNIGFYAPVLILPQLIFHHLPFVLGGYLAVAASDICYETFHPLEHRSAEWWEERKNNPVAIVLRPFVDYLRRFHEYHHLNINYNMAVAGFFGFPLADLVFGTYKMMPVPLTDGAHVTSEDIAPPPVTRFVRRHDLWAKARSNELLQELGQVAEE